MTPQLMYNVKVLLFPYPVVLIVQKLGNNLSYAEESSSVREVSAASSRDSAPSPLTADFGNVRNMWNLVHRC